MRRVLCLCLLFPIAVLATPPDDATIRAEFATLCQAQRADEYFGTQVVDDLRRRLTAPGQSLEVQVGIRGRLGRELRRLGRLDEAIALLEEALELGGDVVYPGLRLEVTRDLAVTHLLLAEDENCVALHGPLACRLPIAPDAVHTRPEQIRRAGDLLLTYLDARPDNLEIRWLYNLTRMISGDFPGEIPPSRQLPSEALASDAPFEPWPDLAPRLGVDALDLAGGALVDDFDGDGLLDLVSSTWDPCGPMKAFRNDGRGGFEDVSVAWGLDAQLGGLNLVHGDFDNDGAPDILVLRGAWRGRQGEVRNSLLRNDVTGSTGRFVDLTHTLGMATQRPTQTAAWADYDGDGDLDLYVGNESSAQASYPSELWRNDGPTDDGSWTFTDITTAAGVENLRFAKGVTWGDFDDDGDPDLYVSNMGPNRLYRNDGPAAPDATDGAWRFTDVAAELGVTEPEGASFASWFFDHDNDGDLDLFVADYGAEYERVFASYFGVPGSGGQPRLYRNDIRATGRFTEISRQVGLERPLLPMGSNHGDLDNDGFPDIYLGTGVPNLEAVMPNAMYRNAAEPNGGGRRFVDVSAAGGFAHIQKGHGVAFGDLDNDGDQDLFEQMGGAYPVDAFFNALYENPGDGNQDGHRWITLRLEGRRANRFGVGARIAVRVRDLNGGTRHVHALVGSGGSFGGSSLQQEIGLGHAAAIEEIVVRWPGGGPSAQSMVQTFRDVPPDRIYRVVEGEAELAVVEVELLRLGSSPSPRRAHAHHAGFAGHSTHTNHDAQRHAEPSSSPRNFPPELPRVRSTPPPELSAVPRPSTSLAPQNRAALDARLAPLRQQIATQPQALQPRMQEIAVLLDAKQYELARDAATAAMQAMPLSPDPPYLRGIVALSRGALGNAEMDFRRALTLEPHHVPALNNLAVVVAAREAKREAMEILERVLEVVPDDTTAKQNLERLRAQSP